jgi:acetyl-CoA acetyltransferase
MDAAWALYEAWVRLQEDDIDAALVYGFGKSSLGNLGEIFALQLDPYVMAPLWPDPVSLAALQARALLDSGRTTEQELAEIAARNRRRALTNPNAQVAGEFDVAELLAEDYVVSPLRRHTLPPITDGACAIVLAVGGRAYELAERPAWITGIDHRVETHAIGARDLTHSPSTRKAGEIAGALDGGIDIAELHAPFASQEVVVRDALSLGDNVDVNPSGGVLAANPIMSAGLARIGEAASRILDGTAGRALAHATSGPLLQQNLVAVLERG